MEDNFMRQLKAVQTSLHDQIGAVKADAEQAKSDVDTVLQLLASVEPHIHESATQKEIIEELEAKVQALAQVANLMSSHTVKIATARMLAGVSTICSRLACTAVVMMIARVAEQESPFEPLQKLLAVLQMWDDVTLRVAAAETVDQLQTIQGQFQSEYMDIQGQVRSLS